ncbi:Flavodoxin-like protein [Xylariaceae sp. FL0255]|nr:Flavodoxin-like protein [Xylariaceae sp. FL0255]
MMKVFIVFAHPEPQSFNGSLLQVVVDKLEHQGHEVKISDLYGMKWKAQVDRTEFLHVPAEPRLKVAYASAEATAMNTLTDDLSMPAILKGWFERVYSLGFAYGLGEYNERRWGDRYGEGKMLGKRAMLVVTAGGWIEHFSPRGISGPIDDLLLPITHGLLYYPGFTVLLSFVVYQTDRADGDAFEREAMKLRDRIRNLTVTDPIDFRPQNGGDYEIPTLTLKAGLEDASTSGFSLHHRMMKAPEELA